MNSFKSVSTPSASALSTKVSIDFSPVPLDELQQEVVARTLAYLGKTTYNLVKGKIKSCLTAQTATFNHVEVAFMMIGIEGSLTILMLLSEWGLSNYVTDFDYTMDQFLDSYSPNV